MTNYNFSPTFRSRPAHLHIPGFLLSASHPVHLHIPVNMAGLDAYNIRREIWMLGHQSFPWKKWASIFICRNWLVVQLRLFVTMWMEWDESKKENLLFQLLDSPKDTDSRLVQHEPSICSAIMASHAGSESDPAIACTSILHFLLWCIPHSAEVLWLCTFDTLLAIWCRQNCDTMILPIA